MADRNVVSAFQYLAIALALPFIAAACSAAPQSDSNVVPVADRPDIVRPLVNAEAGAGIVYTTSIVGTHYNTVFEYSQKTGEQVGEITGFDGPSGLAVDSEGDLYVNNCLEAEVFVFPPGVTKPSLTLTGTDGAQTIAVSAAGEVAVVAFDYTRDITYASFYHKGATKPFKRIGASYFLQNDTSPFAAYDERGNLYITGGANNQSVIGEIIGGGRGSAIEILGITNLFIPQGIAVDHHNHLLVADEQNTGSGVIYEYKLPNPTAPIRTIQLGFSDPQGIALTKSEHALYVASYLGNVYRFSYPSAKSPTQTIVQDYPSWVAISPAAKP
jgi:hypothetical protein